MASLLNGLGVESPVSKETEAPYSPFNHLLYSINARRPDKLFGMFTCYFDESGGSDHGFIAVCGFIASVERWQAFEVAWREMLVKYDLPYLHMKEFAHSNGPYREWKGNEQERARFLIEATAIIQQTVLHGFLCRVSFADFAAVNREYLLGEYAHSPYALAGRFCIAQANKWVGQQGRTLRDVQYVFDYGGPDAGGLVAITQRDGLHIPSFDPSRDTENMAGMVQLQAADFFAYELRKAVVDHPDLYTRPEEFRKSFQALFSIDVDQGNYGEAELREFCVTAHIPERSAPVSA